MLLVPDAALVLLGFGRGFERELARDPSRALPVATSPSRPDIRMHCSPGPPPPMSRSCHCRPSRSTSELSTPNKFWEALAAGTPVVVPWA